MGTSISLHAVSKSYGRIRVLQKVMLGVDPGAVIGLIGANGSGKTTLLRILLGLVRADEGRITVGGLLPSLALSKHRVGYFSGGATLPNEVRVRRWAGLFGTADHTTGDARRFRALSRGQRQLVGLRVALARPDLDLVVLDEPWEGLDPSGSRWLSDTLLAKRQQGTTAIVSSHRFPDLADVCDRYAVLHQGIITSLEVCEFKNGVTAERLRDAYDRIGRMVDK